jgi:hypothetical protein
MRGQDKIIFAWLDCQIAHCHRWEPAAFELRPCLPTINRNVKAKLGPEKKQVRFHDIFLDDVGVTSNTLRILRRHEWHPGFPVVTRAKDVRCHVAKGMTIERGVGRACIVVTSLHPAHP